MLRRFTISSTLILSAMVCLQGTFPSTLTAQRYYQRYWAEKYEEMEDPVVVEDQLEPLDFNEEIYLYQDLRHLTDSTTIFPSTGDPLEYGDSEKDSALSEYSAGAFYLETNSLREASKQFEKSLEKDPDNLIFKEKLALLLIKMEDLSRAQTLLEELLEVDENNFRALINQGEIAQRRNRYDEAKKFYQQVLEIKENNIEALISLAQISFQVDQDLEKTKDYSQRVLHVDDSNLTGMLLNAEASAYTGEAQHAADLYRRLVRYQPAMVQHMMEVGRQLLAFGKWEDAAIIFESAMIVAPQQDSIRMTWEKIIEHQKGEDGVREAYERLVGESKKDLKVYELYADYLERKGDWESLNILRGSMLDIDPGHLQSLISLATYSNRLGDNEKADYYFNQALESNPADPETYLLVAESYMSRGEIDKAQPLLERALVLDPDDAMGLQTLARIEIDKGNVIVAEEHLQRAIELSPADSKLLKQLAGLYLEQGDRRQAAEVLQQVTAIDINDITSWSLLTQLAYEDNDEVAISYLKKEVGKNYRKSPDVALEVGRVAFQFNDLETARHIMQRVVQVSPRNIDGRMILAYTFVELGLPKDALKAINGVDRYLNPDDENLRIEKEKALTSLYIELKDFPKAEGVAKKLQETYPNSLEIRGLYLETLAKQGKEEGLKLGLGEVVKDFKLNDPVNTELLRAHLYDVLGDKDRSFNILKSLAGKYGGDVEVQYKYALAASKVDLFRSAEKSYKSVIEAGSGEHNPYFASSCNNLGFLYAENSKQLDKAEGLALQALDLEPNAPYILNTLGWIYYQKNEFVKSRKYLERAARLDPNDTENLYHLGQLYEAIDEPTMALETYEKAVKTNPDLDEVNEKIMKLKGK
jgi:tetratricopeptide (TPR) repeat protein